MPTDLELCCKLDVKPSLSDPLTEEDLRSAKTTRQAIHRELIRRRPGIYPRRWFAHRLGLSTDTIDRYNREIPVNSRSTYYEKPLHWRNVHELPAKLEVPGTFLEIETGKRYPPKREIAQMLLAKKHTVTYRRRGPNFYWYGEEPPSYWLGNRIQFEQKEPASQPVYPPFQRPAYQIDDPLKAPSRVPASTQTPQNQIPWKQRPVMLTADQLYERINKLAQADKKLSQANAQKLLNAYGSEAVLEALERTEELHQQKRVGQAVGFLTVNARMAWKEVNGAEL